MQWGWMLLATLSAEGAELLFSGLKEFPEAKAREVLSVQWKEIERRELSPSRASDAAFFLELALKQQGFADAEVEAEMMGAERLRLLVREGKRRRLGEVKIEGEEALSETLLREAMIKETKKRQGLLESDRELPYVRAATERGVQAIEGYARYQGYLEAKAELLSVSAPDAQGRVDITVKVVEGPAYRIKEIVLTGIEGRLFEKLRRRVEGSVGKPLNVTNVRAVQAALLQELNDRGYFNARVEATRGQPSGENADYSGVVTFEVDPGPMFRVHAVEVSGVKALSEDFLHRRFEPLQGKAYDPEEVTEVYRDLVRTGLFENLEVTPEPMDPEAGLLALKVKVEEAKFRSLGFYGGFGSFDGYILGTSLTHRNMFGRGHEMRGQVEINGRGVVGELNYLNRWLLGTEWQLGGQLFSGTRELPGYDKWEIGLRGTLTYAFTEHTSVSLYGGFSHVSLTENRFVDVPIGPEDYQVQTLGASLNWDHRNDLETDGHGYLMEVSVDYATSFLVSDVSFVRGNVNVAHYWKLPWDTELRVGLRAGAMHPLGDTDVIPVDLRFFNGGSRTVRSFPERELGAQDRRRHPLGGEFYSVFNLEYAIPLQDSFSLAVFGDAGNLLESVDAIGLTDMHYAAGMGLRYELPIGPLRVDYGFNLNREKGEPKGTLHLGFGFAF